jgi:hypothetical protein
MESGPHWAASDERPARGRWARRSAALIVATLAEAGLLWLTALQRPSPFPMVEAPGLPVWLASPSVLRVRHPPIGAPAKHARPAAGGASPAAVAIPSVPLPPSAAPPGPSAPPSGAAASGLPAGVASALRGSLIGCANVAALSLSETEQAGCRDRLAAGAAFAPLRSGIPPDKRAYYDAVLSTEAAFRRNPMGGHGPAVFCYPGAPARPLPHAIKIGPCYIEPPQGSLDVDVDVPEVGSQRGSQPPPR